MNKNKIFGVAILAVIASSACAQLHPGDRRQVLGWIQDSGFRGAIQEIAGSQVWTNDTDAGSVKLLPTNSYPIQIIDSPSGRSVNISYKTAAEITLGDAAANSDWYSYIDGNGVAKSVFVLSDERGYGGALLIDPAREDGATGFHFSTGISNSVAATDTLFELQNNGTNKLVLSGGGTLSVPGTLQGTNGVASFDTTAGESIAATGWTNIFGKNATVYVTATAIAFTIKNRANATIYTSPTLTATETVTLQPGWSVNAASGLAGTALPW